VDRSRPPRELARKTQGRADIVAAAHSRPKGCANRMVFALLVVLSASVIAEPYESGARPALTVMPRLGEFLRDRLGHADEARFRGERT